MSRDAAGAADETAAAAHTAPDTTLDLEAVEAAVRPLLARVCVVLVQTTHPGNLGATARALMNLGLADLRLVAPVADPLHPDAIARAAGATDLLEAAQLRPYPSLADAVADAHRVVGTSARRRGERAWATPRALAPDLVADAAAGHRIALVFGTERTGLTNQELDRCTDVAHVPTVPGQGSLNLAQAVLLVGYELRIAALDCTAALPAGAPPRRRADQRPATGDELESLFAHLERSLRDVGFLLPHTADKRMRFLRKILLRAAPTSEEARFLRGLAERFDNLHARLPEK